MANPSTKLLASPAFLGTAAANVYTPAQGSTSIYDIVKHIHIANVTGNAATFSLFIGATAGSASGTQLFGTQSVAANAPFDYYTALKLISTTFLSGLASTASALTITVEGEQYVV